MPLKFVISLNIMAKSEMSDFNLLVSKHIHDRYSQGKAPAQ